jgi:hypothetical protein
MTAARTHWPELLVAAADIVDSYETGVTLRQLFYRLVAAKLLPNTTSAYKGLSSKTAEARRQGEFPDLIDRGRLIHRRAHWASPAEALQALARQYRQDRTEGQDVSVYIGVEKAGLVMQLESWFGDLGIPILALGGYSSQTYVDDVVADVEDQDRPAVLLYSGNFDPSGEDIDRDFAGAHRLLRQGGPRRPQRRAGRELRPAPGHGQAHRQPGRSLRGPTRRPDAGRARRLATGPARSSLPRCHRRVLGRVRLPGGAPTRARSPRRPARCGRRRGGRGIDISTIVRRRPDSPASLVSPQRMIITENGAGVFRC